MQASASPLCDPVPGSCPRHVRALPVPGRDVYSCSAMRPSPCRYRGVRHLPGRARSSRSAPVPATGLGWCSSSTPAGRSGPSRSGRRAQAPGGANSAWYVA
jgi:hypothetical protein